jgi:hypothetical protein
MQFIYDSIFVPVEIVVEYIGGWHIRITTNCVRG